MATALMFMLGAELCPAVQVRLATFNVLFGVGTPGSVEYNAVRSILQRVNPDIIAFQELLDSDYDNWVTMAADLGYPYLAYGSSAGPLTGSQRLGFFSKVPIDSAAEVTEYPGATELSRYPLRVAIKVPGALNPFVVYTVHLKASSGSVNEFRRAIEGRRTLSNLVAYIEANPGDTEYAILGDFNQDVNVTQTASFSALPSGLPTAYDLGDDVVFPVPYRVFPTDRFTEAELAVLPVTQEDSTSVSTYSSGGRLDYLLLSREIRENPYGAPVGEIYNSTRDDGSGGLPKFGTPLAASTSADASDHFLVFTDFHMIDALPCVNPVLMISEICDHPTAGASFVELHNSGASPLVASNYALVVYIDGANPVQIPFSATVPAGGSFVIAANASSFQSAFASTADLVSTNLLSIDGNDVIALRNDNQLITDIYGVIGEPAGSSDLSMTWAYPTSRVMRAAGISDPFTTWSSNEWAIGAVAAATPGAHEACDVASVYFQETFTTPAAPRTGDLVSVSAVVVPNFAASNLVVTAVWSTDGSPLTYTPMTENTNGVWQAALFNPGAIDGSIWKWHVTVSFDGPGAGTVSSVTNTYAFPLPPVLPGADQPRFNEVEPDDASTDDREFIELIAPAGMNLAGYRIVHHNGATNTDTIIWSYTLPAFVVPNDGVLDAGGGALGFCVLTTNGAALVANRDLSGVPAVLQNGPGDGLILYDPASNIVDAIVWDGAGDLPLDDPGTVVTNGDPEADNYLHVIPADNGTDLSLQAPNNVLGSTGTDWSRTTATPGALNIGQTSGFVRIRAAVFGDQDADGFADNIDNCPELFNPIQTDIDQDGLGDACDPDRDGDGVLDVSDNCLSTSNAVQEDLDLDGIGDACDPDRDNDGVENDEDLCPDAADPLQSDLDGDGLGDACDPDDDGDGVPDASDNCPLIPNADQADLDLDSTGDVCDDDDDGDGVPDAIDNCPVNANPGQADLNANGVGDACEQDTDEDGVPDLADNCPFAPNTNQIDGDGDGLGDACDACTGTSILTNLVYSGFPTGLPSGWTIVTTGQTSQAWRFDDPVFRGNRTGGTGLFAIAESSIASRNLRMDTQLRTPSLSLANVQEATLSFRTDFDYRTTRSNEIADVDISLNGGTGPWSNVWRRTSDFTGAVSVELAAFAGATNAMIRFHYYNAYQENYWQVDDVAVACLVCKPPPDGDGDGVGDPGDNCPSVYNPGQADADRDGTGDVCDDDADGDGIPDLWETTYFGGATNAVAGEDQDGDGYSNLDEFILDTVPTNRASILALQSFPNDDGWQVYMPNSASGRIYTLIWRSTLEYETPWQPSGLIKTGTGSAITFSFTNQETLLFFRAVIEPANP